ncbi:MAG: c-type cytochrome, partial [Aliifodinibius sp.]|nr:c-type cytochrome [Candidatus Saccharibacteria bacterium]NIV12288.1 c-type cytochrome [Fodinibius sp.]
MKKLRYFLQALLFFVGSAWLVSGQAAIQGDAERGKAKAATCAACHGPDGNAPVPNFPKIAGQHPNYFIEQMQAYKEGAEGPRPNP